tara:strand:+ start:284 stop:1600 length:1317 start_codon:yes stop_codon:yes gene_type:complete
MSLNATEPMPTHGLMAHRAPLLHFLAENNLQYFPDGVLLLDTATGNVVACGGASALLEQYPQAQVTVHDNALIMPGLIDTHIHFPQVDVIASYGEQLLEWLNNYTFPTEAGFADQHIAETTAEFFLQELLRNGTTTAAVYGSVHASAADAFFKASYRHNTRMIMGKSMMDRNTPDNLSESTEQSLRETRDLISYWHNNGRQLYAATLRFVVTSSAKQMDDIHNLMEDYPDLYMQTHLAENLSELELVKSMYPERLDYVDVFDHHGLLGPRSIFGHGIHLSERELQRLQDTQSRIAFCPTSNLFLGSGLYQLDKPGFDIHTGIATDVGAGTSFSMLQTLHEAYKVCQLNGTNLSPTRAFYMATLGNAKALSLDDKIGNFEAGKEADFIVCDLAATPLMQRRQAICKTLDEQLFALMILGDDRAIRHTYVNGSMSACSAA